MITLVTAFLILFGSTFVVSAFKDTAGGRADSARKESAGPRQALTGGEYVSDECATACLGASSAGSSFADPPVDPAEYQRVKRLAAKRLRLLGGMELQRNHARGQLRKLRQALRSSVRLGASGLERGFLCIHSFEGSWTDPNPPHYGGLQFDDSFQRTYGPEFYRAYGTANHWTPSMQMAAAMRAYLSGRGYGPWPNTRKSCGI